MEETFHPGPWLTKKAHKKWSNKVLADCLIASGTEKKALLAENAELRKALKALLGEDMPPAGTDGHIYWPKAVSMARTALDAQKRGTKD